MKKKNNAHKKKVEDWNHAACVLLSLPIKIYGFLDLGFWIFLVVRFGVRVAVTQNLEGFLLV